MSLIKEALNHSDRFYKERLYPDKENEKSKVTKPFCFSVMLPKVKELKKEPIQIDENFVIEDIVFHFKEKSFINFLVSSYDYEFILNLYNGILRKRIFGFPDGPTFTFKDAILLREKKIEKDWAILKTMSPILIETEDDKPILPTEDLGYFNQKFETIHDRILKDIRGFGLKKALYFEPIEIKKQVVKHTLKGFREKTGKPYMTLTCFEGYFKLKGDSEDLQTLYQIGLGLRTGQGLGMVEVIK